jgi:hypothetical protein
MGVRGVIVGVLVTAAAGGAGLVITSGGGGTTITCDQSTASASLASLNNAITAASNGQTVCLAQSGNYGVWTGTTKTVTIIPQVSTGARNPTQAEVFLNLAGGDSGFTIDGNRTRWDDTVGSTGGTGTWTGLRIRGAYFTGGGSGPQNVTIKNSLFQGTGTGATTLHGACPDDVNGGIMGGGCVEAPNDGTTAGTRNVLFLHNVFRDMEAHDGSQGYTGMEAAVRMTDDGNLGWTFKNNLFYHLTGTDGLKLGGSAEAINNLFDDIDSNPNPFGEDIHPDAIQAFGAVHARGNWVFGSGVGTNSCEEGFTAFDGVHDSLFEHNLVLDCDTHQIAWQGDHPASTFRFNTVYAPRSFSASFPSGRIECGARPRREPGSRTSTTTSRRASSTAPAAATSASRPATTITSASRPARAARAASSAPLCSWAARATRGGRRSGTAA